MDINTIRRHFPLLSRKINGKPVVYFDNACSSLRPLPVLRAMEEYYRDFPACGGRSMHKLGEIVTQKVEEARGIIAKFIHARRKEEIIFTRNTTESINLIAHSMGFKQGDVILTTDKEHNSNLIPWQILAEKIGIIHLIVPSRKDNTFDLERFESMMNDSVKLVSMGQTSNLDGVSIPAEAIIKIAHRHGAKVLLDAAQAAPHRPIDVTRLDVDFLAFSGHKMLGPSGTGVLYGKYALLDALEPFLVGGDTVEYSTYESHKFLPLPEKFEAGLQNYAGIIGFGAAIQYLNDIGFSYIARQERELNQFITETLTKIPGLTLMGSHDPALRSGIVSFCIEGIDSHQIALILDQTANIMIRSGQHCVHSWFSAHKIKGSARASLYFYNTLEEAQLFVDCMNKIILLHR
ncbi:cysteine desulfurase [Candidatus Peregrinibacteria bacterium]|nr:cysteine desulfurase [Candidatus Peregrinibacteria bacterium]